MSILPKVSRLHPRFSGSLLHFPTRASLTFSTFKRAFSSPPSDKLTRGDIVLFKGAEDQNQGDVVHWKNRPHIIVSTDKVTDVTGRVILAPLSSAIARLEYEIVLPNDEETGLKKPSKVMANQINTVALSEGLVKIGHGAPYLPQINHGLAMCFGDTKISGLLEISRGDVVEIDFGRFVRTGIVVSNDLGNRASRIAMLANSLRKKEELHEFDLIVRKHDSSHQEKLLVQCYMINTLAQELMDRKGRILEEDMQKITTMIYKTLGIV